MDGVTKRTWRFDFTGSLGRHQPGPGLALFVLALIAYSPGMMWGLPEVSNPERVHTWAYDEIAPLHALTEVYHTFVEGAPDRWLAYPLLHHSVVAAAYSPYLLWLVLLGGFSSPTATYGLEDPVRTLQTLTVIARLVSIAMAAGIVVTSYWIGATLWDKSTGVLASLICLVPYVPHVLLLEDRQSGGALSLLDEFRSADLRADSHIRYEP